jgi:PEP-CTERM motif
MRLDRGIALAVATFGLLACVNQTRAGVISQWNFGTTESARFNSPAPDVGSGTATVLGMNNNYIFSGNNTITGSGTFTFTGPSSVGSVASADILATAGDPNGFANAWRIRGPSNNLGDPQGNGWGLQAPQFTQGAQFSSSTAGFNVIAFHFDWFTTTQGVKNMQEQYTLDGVSWININSPLTAVSNGWLSETINFSAIPGANNDPNFGVRLVSAYDNALSIPNYGSADGGQNGYYNNNSGNWRFADVGFTGTLIAAVPEPSTTALAAVFLGMTGMVVWRRRAL